ncbi:Maf-like protein, putative [Plasmodium reichenowi]|uniref:Maf-like protein, putative n=1 Tax=Plasmodium reichenowi TaxID=5854 RepID=A0A2P9DEJ2_PLARE|nr:Maf-like protein, putative [Plasmodium reichenowi]
MNNHNFNNQHNSNSAHSEKSEMKNGLFLKKNMQINKNDEIAKELDLEFDEEIISRLLCLVHNKNVKHKVLKINNLIDENLYNYIVNSEENKNYINNNEHETTEEQATNGNLHNEKELYNIQEKMKTNISQYSIELKKFLIDNNNYDTTTKYNNNNNNNNNNNDNSNNNNDNNYDNNNYINKTTKENNDFYYKKRNDNINSLGETNNVLFLCYDETNDDCTTCDKYRKNYMSNMEISNNIDINKLNDLNDYFFILGSTSTSRKYILKKSNLNFLSVRIHIDEKKIGCRKKHDPFTLTSNISVAKGLKLLSMIKKDSQLKEQIFELAKKKKIILLVGDEVIYCNNKIYEKPTNQKEATDFLKSYNNNKCFSYSSITLIEYETEKIVTGIDESVINIYDMNDNIIKNILEDSSIYFCAGALKIENIYMHKHINVIKGNIDSIFGLSINLLFHLLTIL